ncbi:hypothetical protein GTP45_25765 [Pseudoduganella sp. FT55W]|uniref:Uncharacterized protein n=2 Tax=Duganella rivi TaxID=2666083 RepID=A0A7X4GW19_9BURK|nr:hypothetical protein [Duganella rivi]
MNDTLDFVKNLWGSMSVPGLTAPTLSVEELDKKINDLKAVESWLNLNMSMLRGSIQALEVQRGTIATLKSVGASLASAVNTGVNDKSIFDSNPYASAFFHHAREADKAQTAPTPTPAPAAAEADAKAAPTPTPEAPKSAGPTLGAGAGQPNAWWNLLQDQFKQAVSTAIASETMMADAAVKFAAAAAGAGTPPAAAKPTSAPAASASAAAPDKAPAAVKKPAAKKPAAKKAAVKPVAKPAADKP